MAKRKMTSKNNERADGGISSIVTNCLIVLGHSGWFNSGLWEKDVLSSPNIGAVLYVEKTRELTDFEKKYSASEETCSMETQWGSSSLVFVTNALLREAMAKYPLCQNFWVISGTSIPVAFAQEYPQESKTVFESGKLATFMIHDNQICLNKHNDAVNPIEIPEFYYRQIKDIFPTFTRDKFRYCSQWCRLSLTDAQHVVSFDYSPFAVLDKFLCDSDVNTELRGRTVRPGCTNAVFAPDEYYYSLALALHHNKGVPAGPVCSMTLFQSPSDPSPITFKSLDEHVEWQVCEQLTAQVKHQMTLRQAIKACRELRAYSRDCQDTLMTLRKVEDIDWHGKGLSEVVTACNSSVNKKINEEFISAITRTVLCSSNQILPGQKGYIQPKSRAKVYALTALHPNKIPETALGLTKVKVGQLYKTLLRKKKGT